MLVCERECQKSYWSGKKQKTYFSIQNWFCPLFCEKVNFLTAPARSCCRCGQLDIGVTICVWWLATPFNYYDKEFQIFSPCWTTLPIWQISNTFDLQHVLMFIINPMIPTANTNLEDWIWTCGHVEDLKCLKFVRCFCCYSASTKTSFGFCSCSELLQLTFGKKNVAGKCKFLSQDSYRGD